MPRYQPARSDAARLAVLTTASTVAPVDIAAGRPSITQATLDALNSFLALFRPLVEALSNALSGRMREVREREAARSKLDTYVRDFLEVLKRRAHRLEQPAEVLVFYGLPSDGAVPVMASFETLIAVANAIVAGEPKAVAAGYPAMANPSLAELQPVLAEAVTQAADVPPADRTYDDAQAAVAARRPEADLVIEDIHGDLISSLRRLDPPGQRRVMRNYGLVFSALPGEPEEAPAAPAAGEPPATGGGAGDLSPTPPAS